jgi:hypothetical protein
MKKNISEEAYFQRLQNLAEVKKVINKTSTLGSLIDYQKASDGVYYGIVKENHNYYIKKAVTSKTPDVTDFTYIGGLENVLSHQYKSLSEADKNRNMILGSINESSKYVLNPKKNKIVLSESAKEEIEKAEASIPELDAATEEASEPTEEIPSEIPTEEIPTEETPEIPTEDAPSEEIPSETDGDIESTEDSEEGDKEILKTIGKLADKIRKTDMESVEVKSYVNSFLSAFTDKFRKLEIEDRKKMADKILKVVDKEDVDSIEVEESAETCSECGSFAKYAESRGYTKDSIMECDGDEMNSLVSGYANAYNDGKNGGDFESIAIIIKPEGVDSLKNDYGHTEFADKLTPYTQSMNEMTEEDKLLKINEMDWTSDEEEKEMVTEEDDINIDTDEPVNDTPNEPVIEPEIGFAPEAEMMGMGVVSPNVVPTSSLDVNVDNANKTINISMNENKVKLSESEEKVKKYIVERIQVAFGDKKAKLNEGVKSDKLKKLDAMIDEQIENFKKSKKENVNEVFGLSVKEKFQKLSPTDKSGIDSLFTQAFNAILTNPQMGVIGRIAKSTPTQIKYDILKQYVENDGGTLRLQNGVIVYAPKSLKDKATKSNFAAGGTGGKPSGVTTGA